MEKLLFQVMMAVSDFILRKDLGSPSPAHVCEEAINPKPRKEYSGSYSPPSMKSPCEVGIYMRCKLRRFIILEIQCQVAILKLKNY
jgi:hypothetical protein